ncbi:MAG TPA: TonB-dependent receptor plug domain-containing protein, partial [Candidatus Polarisedimenticolaceae bacterium]|nr:TonB-dependent receptor plug domain-containing protein [Candidatus Polarisedimenticolaceae bacterium]
MNRFPLRDAVRLALLGLSTLATAPSLGQEAAEGQAEPTVLEDIEVVGRQRSAADDILQERIDAAVVQDLVNIEQITRVGDSTVSAALRRLPGVTLVADQFIYIRGLGERYSSTTVNGAFVPSPDLTRNVIPMDLFPAEIVESISIQKGFTADQPAAFGGGNVDVRTRAIPEDFLFNVSLGIGTNSGSSDDGLTYAGGSDDRLGDDDGTRALPRAIDQAIRTYRGNLSQTNIFNTLLMDGQDHTFAEAQGINRELAVSLNRDVDFRDKSMEPDKSIEISAGNSWFFGDAEQWKFGVIGVADYNSNWRNRERTVRSVTEPTLDFDEQFRTVNQTVLTGYFGAGIDYADEHRIEATGIFLRNTEDEASLTLGQNFNFRRENGDRLRNYRIRFEQRELELLQVRGSHALGDATLNKFDWAPIGFAEGLVVDWYYSDAEATTDIPSEITFSARDRIDPASGELLSTSLRSSGSAAEYRFTDLQDTATSYGWQFTMPYQAGSKAIEISGGYDYYEKGRGYLQKQLQFGTTASAALPILVGTPGQVFTDEHILDPVNEFSLSVGGIGTESYLAGETVDAVWGNFDVNFNEAFRVTAGLRWEDFSRLAVPIDPLEFDVGTGIISIPAEELPNFATTEDGFYPSLAFTWMKPGFRAGDFQLRLGWSETVARPDLREISDATYIDPLTEARVRGNPLLDNSDLSNLDLRAEWFFAGGDNLTVSLFYKDITAPIETVEAAGT